MSRKRLLLLLLVVLLFAVWNAWEDTPRQKKASSNKRAKKSSVASVGKRGFAEIVELNFSGGEKLDFITPKRDLFRPIYRPPVIASRPAPPPPKPAPVVVKKPVAPPPLPRPVVPPVSGTKPIPPLNVLGFMSKGATTTAFLATRQGDLYLVKKGDRFADGLLVRELNQEQIVISRGKTDTGVTLTVGEPKTLRMAIPNVPSGRPAVPEYKGPTPKEKKPVLGLGKKNS